MDNIQVIERAFTVLEIIAQAPDVPHTISGLSEKSGLKTATASRIIRTMTNLGYLEQVGRKEGYILGGKTASLSEKYNGIAPLRKAAMPLLREFGTRFGEYICISVLRNNQRHIIYVEKSTHAIQVANDPMAIVETPYRSVSGRILLAGLTREQQKRCFAQKGKPGYLWKEISSQDDFLTTLENIAKKEFLLECVNEVARIGVPVNKNGKIIAAIGSFMPMYRFVENKGKILSALQKIAFDISKKLNK